MSDARLFFLCALTKINNNRKGERFFFPRIGCFKVPLLIFCSLENNRKCRGHIFQESTFCLCVRSDTDWWRWQRGAWFLSATKWAEVKAQPGSYRVMLSVRWRDKHRRRRKEMKGDKREWWRRESLTGKKKCLPNTYKTRLWLREISCYTVAHKELVEYFKEG